MKYLSYLFAVVLLVVMASCSSMRVSTDYDRNANFRQYRTFRFDEQFDNIRMNDLNKRRLKDAITYEMESKGYSYSANSDLVVNAFIKGKQKYSANATTNRFGAGYPYYWGWGYGTSNTQVDVERYVEGTLFVDLVDVEKKQMIWEGVAKGIFTHDTKNKERKIQSAVSKMFRGFPQ